MADIRDIHVSSCAALSGCWQRIPTETTGRAVRESDRMLLGSAHAVPLRLDVGWRRWQSAARRLASSASQMMHLNPNACTTRTARPDALICMGCWPLAICTEVVINYLIVRSGGKLSPRKGFYTTIRASDEVKVHFGFTGTNAGKRFLDL